jgi:peptidoglycan/LPS O-acetylase OafA/YrhL
MRKRIIRIYPIYLLLAAAQLALLCLLPNLLPEFKWHPWKILSALALIPQENFAILVPAWTLSHEMLFYLLFGAMILLGSRVAIWTAIVWAAAIIAFQFIRFVYLPSFEPPFVLKFFLKGQNLEFIVGCAAAIFVRKSPINARLALGSALVLILCSFWLVKNDCSPPIFGLLFLPGSFLLMRGCTEIDRNSTVRWPKSLLAIGDASFSIYLTHYTVLSLLLPFFAKYRVHELVGGTLTPLIGILISVLFGWIVYYFIERNLLAFLRSKLLPRTGQAVIA